MSQGKIEKLARMANQIGDYYAASPVEQAAAGFASHLRKYWTPKMILELLAAVDNGAINLHKTAAHGVAVLKQENVSAV